MFDIGPTELLFDGTITLIVVRPKSLSRMFGTRRIYARVSP